MAEHLHARGLESAEGFAEIKGMNNLLNIQRIRRRIRDSPMAIVRDFEMRCRTDLGVLAGQELRTLQEDHALQTLIGQRLTSRWSSEPQRSDSAIAARAAPLMPSHAEKVSRRKPPLADRARAPGGHRCVRGRCCALVCRIRCCGPARARRNGNVVTGVVIVIFIRFAIFDL